jgi:4-amino-4-deoxy-L-arabinose transferase-like glycosyltransferase
MKRWQPYLPILGIFFLALAVRVLYNLTVGKNYVAGYDSQAYEKIAFNIVREHCFCLNPYMPTVGRAPLWPGIIAAFDILLGPRNLYVRLFLCLVGSGTCVLVYLFAREVFNKQIALLAGILAIIYPGLFIYDGWLYSESLYTFLLLAFCYTLLLLQQTGKYRWAIASGIILGLFSLTRPNGLLILGLVFLWGIIFAQKKILSWRAVATSIAIICLIALMIVTPWTIRNYQTTHRFVPVATGDGFVVLGAYNDMIFGNTPFRGMWIRPSLTHPEIVRHYLGCQGECEVRQNSDYEHYAWLWVQSHKSEMPYLLSLHFLAMWTPATPEADLPMNQFPSRHSSQIVVGMIQTMSIPVFILAAFGLVVTWRRKWRQLMFIYLVIGLTIGECLIFYGSSRFRAPIEPMLVILLSGGVWWVLLKITNARKKSTMDSTEIHVSGQEIANEVEHTST